MFEATDAAAAGDRADASVQELMDESALASAGGSKLPRYSR